jgi:hypothetical protein
MSMADEVEMLRDLIENANMDDAVARLVNIMAAERIIVEQAENILGEDHLGMTAIGGDAQVVDGLVEQLNEALKKFEETVTNVAKAVIYSLEHPS